MDSSLYLDGEIANIYHRQFHTVYHVCLSFMKNTEDAEDMVQETFLKLINCEMQFESEEHERAWLIVTASNTCKNELRRWKRRLENIRILSRHNYGLTRTMKSSFHPVTLNIGAIEDYHEWNYTTGNGQNVLLANSNSKALILAEKEQSFLVVNVWSDFASDTFEISDEMLEGLADIFDFSEIP